MAGLAAMPIAASAELDVQLRRNAARKRTKSLCPVLDEVLKGGLDSGRITCISGDRGFGKTTVRGYTIDIISSPASNETRSPCNF
jgi:predicted ATP-dependent serine protease